MILLKTKDWILDNVETVLFDKDGTFIDLHYFWGKMTELRVFEIIKTFGLSDDVFEKLCLCLGYDVKSGKMLSDGITALYSRVKIIEIFKQDLENFGVFTTEDELTKIFDTVNLKFYEDMDKYTKPISEAIEFIKVLKSKNVKLGVVTSDSVESTNRTLKQFGWEDFFEVVVGRESSNETKESGALTKLALNILKADSKTTVMIGDAPMDYISAKNSGIERTILVSTGQISSSKLSKTSKYVVKTLAEIAVI